MDEQGFEEYLEDLLKPDGTRRLLDHTVDEHLRKVEDVEEKLGNLIRKGMDGRRVIYETLAYGQTVLHPNQELMEWTLDTDRNTVDPIRNAIQEYRRFCGDFSPIMTD